MRPDAALDGPLISHGVDSTNLVCIGVMRSPSDQPPALTNPTPPAADSDYDSIHAAVMETVRGRWFLSEYARRNRQADTDVLLKAIGRIESFVQEQVRHAPEPVPGENNDNRKVSSDDAQAAEPFLAPKDKLDAANTELLLVREHIRNIADSLIECGAPSFLTNDLKRRLEEIARICTQLGEIARVAQPVADEGGVAADEDTWIEDTWIQEASIEEGPVQADSIEKAALERTSSHDRAMQEYLAEEAQGEEPAVYAKTDDASNGVTVSKPAEQPRRDPFADIRALSNIEKIALFT